MLHDPLAQDLYTEICRIPIIDPHSHINPHRPTARSLDDILGYHYYTELAHSVGMDHGPLADDVDPRERVRAILYHMTSSTTQRSSSGSSKSPAPFSTIRANTSTSPTAHGCATPPTA